MNTDDRIEIVMSLLRSGTERSLGIARKYAESCERGARNRTNCGAHPLAELWRSIASATFAACHLGTGKTTGQRAMLAIRAIVEARARYRAETARVN